MSRSYNGWFASPDLATRPLEVAGESFVPGVLDNDDVYTVLRYVAVQMHERVEPIVRDDWHDMDDWGFNFRLTTNDDSLSCHASGTAIDYNATRHPFNVPASENFTAAQIAEIRQIVQDAGVIVWGGDFNNTPDAMHFEINGSAAEVAAAADRIRNGINQEDEMQDADFGRIRDIVKDELASVEAKTQRIIKKLEAAREREILVNDQLREVRDALDADSPVRRKLNKVIALLQEHDADEAEEL